AASEQTAREQNAPVPPGPSENLPEATADTGSAAEAPDRTATTQSTDPAPAAAPSPRPRPGPGPRRAAPGPAASAPRPAASGPKPPVPAPAALAGKKPSAALLPVAAPVTEYPPEELAAAKSFGSVAEDG